MVHGLRLLLPLLECCIGASRSWRPASPPLPDKDQFVAEARAAADGPGAAGQHTFTERRQEIEISKLGKVSADVTKTY